MGLLEFFSIAVGSAAVVTAALALIAPPLATLIKNLLYPSQKSGQGYKMTSASR